MAIINLTSHVVTVCHGENVRTFEPSGQVARCHQNEIVIGQIDGLPITRQVFGQVEGLPEQQNGIYYIVSRLVAAACPDRADLFCPGPTIKGTDGRITGCTSLCSLYKGSEGK